MKYVKIIIFILAIILSGTALFINFIIVNSKNMGDTTILSDIDMIHLDKSQLSQSDYQKIVEIVSSNNSVVFNKLIKQKRPIDVFYGFCGYMKTNQRYAIDKLLEDMLVSTRQVKISYNNTIINSYLGYAILLLLETEPEWLTNPPIESFYSDGESSFKKAYQSSISKADIEYKKLLTHLAVKNCPNFSKELIQEILDSSFSNKSVEEKLQLTSILPYIDSSQKEEFVIKLLSEKNKNIVKQTLLAITEKDSPEIADAIAAIMKKYKNNKEIAILTIQKYAVIKKGKSLSKIKKFTKSIKKDKDDIIMAGLEQIRSYGDETSYEYLIRYLENSYSSAVNVKALNTIIDTAYKKRREDVMKTMLFTIYAGKREETAIFTIQFHIDNKISSNSGVILSRLNQKESDAMKELAVNYIDTFKLKKGKTLLEELAVDDNKTISAKASAVLKKI